MGQCKDKIETNRNAEICVCKCIHYMMFACSTEWYCSTQTNKYLAWIWLCRHTGSAYECVVLFYFFFFQFVAICGMRIYLNTVPRFKSNLCQANYSSTNHLCTFFLYLIINTAGMCDYWIRTSALDVFGLWRNNSEQINTTAKLFIQWKFERWRHCCCCCCCCCRVHWRLGLFRRWCCLDVLYAQAISNRNYLPTDYDWSLSNLFNLFIIASYHPCWPHKLDS